MPLVPNAVYTIRNELTHTVLGLEGNNAGGYGGVGKDIQQWRLVKQAGNNEWMLHNQRTEDHHVLRSPSDNSRLVVANAGTRRTFVIESIQGSAERYRITLGQLAATLITGSTPQDPNILENDRVFDLQADGAPLVLRGVPVHPSPIDSAQLWSFIPVVELPVKPGTYKIISSHARLVLDLQGGAVDTNVRGARRDETDDGQKWVIARHGNGYTFKTTRPGDGGVGDRFLAPQADAVGNLLRGQANETSFAVRKVPGTTNLYKCEAS
ncbi:hypothetical protein AX14_006484 [Amanita brunnescens Koide BX004]|nr:hypothetical protein AX14_006484 [Amanita brunnescens Koide BX004]